MYYISANMKKIATQRYRPRPVSNEANKKLTSTKEDYLRAIFLLQEKADGSTSASEIARAMHLSKSTVSERLQELARNKMIAPHFYSSIRLTRRGFEAAQKLTYKHRIAEVFLNRVLKIPKKDVHAEAHMLEHALSDTVTRKLAEYLGQPKVDPHGERIPSIHNWSK